jgi:hypothetical protein
MTIYHRPQLVQLQLPAVLSLVPAPSYLFERSQASYERSHPQPTPVPFEPTTFTLVACLSRAYGPYRHHTEELRGVHNSWQGGGNS